jgi:hypothetical protein
MNLFLILKLARSGKKAQEEHHCQRNRATASELLKPHSAGSAMPVALYMNSLLGSEVLTVLELIHACQL